MLLVDSPLPAQYGKPQLPTVSHFFSLNLAGYAIRLSQHPEGVFSQNIADRNFWTSPLEQGFGNPGKIRGVVHPGRHECAVKIRSQAYVIGAHKRRGMCDVLDD